MSTDKQALAENTRVQGEEYRRGYADGVRDTQRSPYYDDSADTKATPANGEAALPASGDVEQRAVKLACEAFARMQGRAAAGRMYGNQDYATFEWAMASAISAALRSQGEAVAVDDAMARRLMHALPLGCAGHVDIAAAKHALTAALAQQANKETSK